MLQSLDPQVRSYITAIESELRETRSDRQSVQARYESLEIRYDHLKEEYRLLLYKRFGKSSEKDPDTDQQSLFEEAEGILSILVDGHPFGVPTYAAESSTRTPSLNARPA
jgi:hypothetical protein